MQILECGSSRKILSDTKEERKIPDEKAHACRTEHGLPSLAREVGLSGTRLVHTYLMKARRNVNQSTHGDAVT